MPRTIRDSVIHPITLRELEVLRVGDASEGMRRVTLTGDQLGSFVGNGFEQPEFRSSGFDDDIKLVFRYPGEAEPVLPIQKDGTIEFPKDRRPLARSYTVRRWDPQTRELDVDLITHGTGVATTWARRCRPGDRIHIAGPTSSGMLPVGVDWMLVVGDDTALPAIGRLLEEAPAGLRLRVFVEVESPAHRQDLTTAAEAEVTWLYRDGALAGETANLDDAVRAMPWEPGEVFAWVAGEALTIKPIRRYLREDRAIPKENVEVTGYWRRGEVVTLAEDPAVPDSDQIEDPFEVIHEMGELLPPIALRVAVTLGLPELISRGVKDADSLAGEAHADPVAIAKLLRYLRALEVLAEPSPGNYELTDVGDQLTQEFVVDVLDLDGPLARQEMGLFGLLEAVRTGQASYASVFGVPYPQLRLDPEYEAAYQEQITKYARYLAPALAADEALAGPDGAGLGHVVVHSDGAGVIAEAIAVAFPRTRVSITGLPSKLAYLGRDIDASIADHAVRGRIALLEQSVFEQPPAADAVLLVRCLDEHADADAAHALRQSAAALRPGGRIVVAEYPLDESSHDDHQSEEDLKNLVLYGTGHRSDAQNRELFAAAGLTLAQTRSVGWGFTLYLLEA